MPAPCLVSLLVLLKMLFLESKVMFRSSAANDNGNVNNKSLQSNNGSIVSVNYTGIKIKIVEKVNKCQHRHHNDEKNSPTITVP
jgi:hypothetical protein